MFKPEEKVLVKKALQRVWGAIASDVAGYVDTNFEAVALCVDCDRLLTHGGPEGSFAHEIIGRVAVQEDINQVLAELADMVALT